MSDQSALYLEFGKKYQFCNVNQSYLCYENAIYHYQKENKTCDSKDHFISECRLEMEQLKKHPQFSIAKLAIVILSYNNLKITKDCIESIRINNLKEVYELVVVDNASTDGVQDWLRQQEDICLIQNRENMGFPYGCNQGIAAAGRSSDILLLNNDTVVPENALFWLRMGLYENERIGAAGSISNCAANQEAAEHYESLEEWMEFARRNNVPMEQPYEKRSWLVGFAMLIRRTALEAVMAMEPQKKQGMMREVLDHRFSPGTYEDNDISIRLLLAGYQLRLVKNSFIYHYGGKAFGQLENTSKQTMIINQKKMTDKYGINLPMYFLTGTSWKQLFRPQKEGIRVLEVGSGLGVTLTRIESMYPDAYVLGLESNAFLARLAANVTNVRNQDFVEDYEEGKCLFDFIIFNESLRRNCAQEMLWKAKRCLQADGKIILVFSNKQCIKENLYQRGESFSLGEVTEACMLNELQIKELHYFRANLSEAEKQEIINICEKDRNANEVLYRIQEFVLGVGI